MLLEAGIVGLVGLAAYRAMQPGPGVMTPTRRKVFQHALNKIDPPLTPEKLNELAALFDKSALPAYADVLRKRATMRAQPPELKAAHRAAYRKGMAAQDPTSVRILANAFEGQGKTAMAAALRNYADGLDGAQSLAAANPLPTTSTASGAGSAPSAPSASSAGASTDPSAPPAPAATAVHGDFGGSEFGGPSTVILASTGVKKISSLDPSEAPSDTTAAPAPPEVPTSPAAELGMTDREYADFLSGR